MARQGDSVDVGGRSLRFTNAGKVLYDATGTTKEDLLRYYLAVAPHLVRYAGNRIVTRKRWPDGIDDETFFEKNLPQHGPDWIPRVEIEHSKRMVRYPVLDPADPDLAQATLAWLAQQAALELHVPQWTLEGGEPGRTRRIVIDLDPGDDVDLDATARIALRIRDLLSEVGLDSWPVTSGSKGIHFYARLNEPVSSKGASAVAKQIAKTLEKQSPELVTATMKRSVRAGKVFLDWSQNNSAKTTVAPYSLRGRAEPWVAAPRSWDELADGGLEHLHWQEVLRRLEADGDLLAGLEGDGDGRPSKRSKKRSEKRSKKAASPKTDDVDDPAPADGCDTGPTDPDSVVTSLAEYRRKRDRRRTPEPFDGERPANRAGTNDDGDTRPVFVIQEHHARRLHYDLRLEHKGVLASWAVPKNLPTKPRDRRLAVQTEDHPLGYETFEGRIPRGEYGAGTMSVWDSGRYECERWRDDEVIFRLDGEQLSGRYVLVRTNAEKNQWIVQFMVDQEVDEDWDDDPGASGSGARPKRATDAARSSGSGDGSSRITEDELPPAPLLPMIPTAGTVTSLPDAKWAFEGKWDGYRVTISCVGGRSRLASRNGNDLTWLSGEFPGLAEALEVSSVLDGELVVLDDDGRPDFAALAKQAAANGKETPAGPVHLFLFDVLELDGTGLRNQPWTRRREVLDAFAPLLSSVDRVRVPDVLDGPGDRALEEAATNGWEGVVAKRRDSRYESGRRSKSWLKEKLLTTTEAVVGGWRPGRGSRSGGFGSLLLGLPTDTGLTYIGRVGTGFDDRLLTQINDELKSLRRKTSPFVDVPSDVRRDAVWVLPKLVVEVEHQGFTEDGNLRHSSFRGIRRDKLPGDV